MKTIKLTINGSIYERDVREHITLLQLLREDLGLTGTKEGCGAGECGACTIIMDGRAVNSCLVLAAEANGAELETIEGVATNEELSAVQDAFHRNHAVQCGFCTPGMIMNAKALLGEDPHPEEGKIREAISGVQCRCTGYQKIVQAVKTAGRKMDSTR